MKVCGSNYLVMVEITPGSGTFNTLFSMRDTTLSISNEQVDITDKGSAVTRQLLAECGINSMSLSGAGLIDNSQIIEDIKVAVHSGAIILFRLVSDISDQYQGPFQVASFERTGAYNGAEEYSVSFESAAKITYTPAP